MNFFYKRHNLARVIFVFTENSVYEQSKLKTYWTSYINISPGQCLTHSPYSGKVFITPLNLRLNVAWCKRTCDVQNNLNDNLLYGL